MGTDRAVAIIAFESALPEPRFLSVVEISNERAVLCVRVRRCACSIQFHALEKLRVFRAAVFLTARQQCRYPPSIPCAKTAIGKAADCFRFVGPSSERFPVCYVRDPLHTRTLTLNIRSLYFAPTGAIAVASNRFWVPNDCAVFAEGPLIK